MLSVAQFSVVPSVEVGTGVGIFKQSPEYKMFYG